MEKWFLQSKKADFDTWAKELGIDVVTARILRNRDIETIEDARDFLYGGIDDMHSPWLMKDMEKAVDFALASISNGKKIRVIGDYDVDGVTSAYILTKGLECLGGNVSTAIPHRIHDGYGLSEDLVLDAYNDGINLIITCDNGISAAGQVELACSKGIDVIVTDHHEVPFELNGSGKKVQILPRALAVVDPKRYDCSYPYEGICGAMVAYKFMLGALEKTKSAELESMMDELMCFATMGTVCDVMELRDENRILVKEGLRKMAMCPNVGLKALMDINKIDPNAVSVYHLGFVIGPCVNASGRLDTALRALELFNEKKQSEALIIATELKELNDSRKNLTNEGIEQAIKYIEDNNLADKKVWLIYLPDIHESIAGIIAGRIREKYNHPVFVLTKGEEMVKGSGRSIEGYHMQEALVAAEGLLEKFGGHAMAAGLSFREENLIKLDEFLNSRAELTDKDFIAKVLIDVPMPLDYGNMSLAKELEKLQPFGNGNPQPLFAHKDLFFIGMTRFGADGKFARYRVRSESGRCFELTSFMHPDDVLSMMDEKYGLGAGKNFQDGKEEIKMSVTYQLDINRYRGDEKIQFLLKNIS